MCFLSELKKVHIEVKEDTAAPPQPTGSEEDEDEEEDEEDEEDDDDDEESERDEEKESTTATKPTTTQGKKKESEDESSESEDDDGRTKEERLYDRAKRRIEVRDVPGGGTPRLSVPVSDCSVCVSIETEGGEHQEHRLGPAEGAGGVRARTRGHGEDQDPGQGLLTVY